MKKNVLITGANSGLGVHLTSKFKSEGYNVLEHKGHKDYDLSNVDEVKNLAQKAIDFQVNILINNAAIVCPNKKFPLYQSLEVENMIGVNLTAPILLSYYLHDYLTNIININSMVGLEVKSPRTLYSAPNSCS